MRGFCCPFGLFRRFFWGGFRCLSQLPILIRQFSVAFDRDTLPKQVSLLEGYFSLCTAVTYYRLLERPKMNEWTNERTNEWPHFTWRNTSETQKLVRRFSMKIHQNTKKKKKKKTNRKILKNQLFTTICYNEMYKLLRD